MKVRISCIWILSLFSMELHGQKLFDVEGHEFKIDRTERLYHFFINNSDSMQLQILDSTIAFYSIDHLIKKTIQYSGSGGVIETKIEYYNTNKMDSISKYYNAQNELYNCILCYYDSLGRIKKRIAKNYSYSVDLRKTKRYTYIPNDGDIFIKDSTFTVSDSMQRYFETNKLLDLSEVETKYDSKYKLMIETHIYNRWKPFETLEAFEYRDTIKNDKAITYQDYLDSDGYYLYSTPYKNPHSDFQFGFTKQEENNRMHYEMLTGENNIGCYLPHKLTVSPKGFWEIEKMILQLRVKQYLENAGGKCNPFEYQYASVEGNTLLFSKQKAYEPWEDNQEMEQELTYIIYEEFK